ncbi:NADH-Ubiquinone oxidoreductase B16.6 subunit [Pediculus humanus corporis]|uniref:NADH dehydrogenase [ubiquinone] 1 alpha subcomplex subunit 13 n=1 Tax=Pediculus humanus subsp. corporis TaxID=121224 RepID=E0VSQ2_PEDHC|nr:NADH-Ubiquinone oxidoreductase B16.6 subunit [Pediculus humanus corporis]EEB16408.1 NADH-Ubiquinone oxidoreductase B16.6 subunit [Pediculus humanus corporis]
MCDFRQDMPPPGGYSKIRYAKVPLKVSNPFIKLGVVVGISVISFNCFLKKDKEEGINARIEDNTGAVALHPLLAAEGDRLYLKALKKNRDDEEKLMKDVEGWEVGKWKGYPVYLTLDPNEFYKPAIAEYFAHAHPKYEQWATYCFKGV